VALRKSSVNEYHSCSRRSGREVYKSDSRQLCESLSNVISQPRDEKTKIAARLQPFHVGDELVELSLGLLVLREDIFVFLLPLIPLLLQGVHLAFEVLGLQIHLTEPFDGLLQVLLSAIELLLQELDLALQRLVRLL